MFPVFVTTAASAMTTASKTPVMVPWLSSSLRVELAMSIVGEAALSLEIVPRFVTMPAFSVGSIQTALSLGASMVASVWFSTVPPFAKSTPTKPPRISPELTTVPSSAKNAPAMKPVMAPSFVSSLPAPVNCTPTPSTNSPIAPSFTTE
jgi:hypothetical protein